MDARFNHYSEEEFLNDQDFLAWVKYGKNDQEWNSWLATKPSSLEAYKNARQKLVVILSGNAEPADLNSKELVWERIQQTLGGKRKVIKLYRWAASAAAALLILFSAFWIMQKSPSDSQTVKTDSKTFTTDSILPGGNKAVLTLADGSTIVLDSAQNGMLSLQGNARVMKLQGGKVAYDQLATSNRQSAIQYNTITTPRGGQYQLELADGSRVWLNAASSITFPTAFTGNKREINITGEAYFEVAHNANKPFYVTANGMQVEVLGTHFNINAYPDENVIKTTLLKGSVKVSKSGNVVLLKPGQQAIVSDGHVELKDDVNTEHEIAWKNGLFDFQNDDLPSVMRQVARWYDVEIVYNPSNHTGHYIGSIRKSSGINEVLKMLELAGNVNFSIIGKKIIVNEKN